MDVHLYPRNERHLLAKNGVDKYIFLCVGDSFYVDPNARNKIQGSHVCCLYFKLEWQSSKCKAEKKKKEFFCTLCTFASVHVGVNAGAIICYAFNRNYLIL